MGMVYFQDVQERTTTACTDSALLTLSSGVVGFAGLLVVHRSFIGHSAAR